MKSRDDGIAQIQRMAWRLSARTGLTFEESWVRVVERVVYRTINRIVRKVHHAIE